MLDGPTGAGVLLRHSRRFWLVLGLILALSVPGCLWGGRVLHHRMIRKRANEYAEKAAAMIASGEIDGAIAQAQAALNVEPANPDGQLQMARAYSAYSNPKALVHWLNYFALSTNVSALASLEFARFNLQLGQPEAARRHLLTLRDTNSPAVLVVRAALETNAATAQALLEAAQRLAVSPGEKLAVAVTGFASPSAALQLAGRGTIMNLARAGESAAQLFLLTQPGTNAAFAVASFELGKRPWLPEWQPLADLISGRSRSAEALVAKLREQPENLGLAQALANAGVDIATPRLELASRSHPGLFFLQADQLCAQRRWAELDQIVNAPGRHLPQDLQAGLGSIAAFGLGDTNTANARMLTALAAAANAPSRLLGLARLGAGKGYPELEAQALMRLGKEAELRDSGGHRLFEMGQQHRRLDWVAAGAQQLAHEDPASAWFGTWVYARCILQLNAVGVPEPQGHQPDSVLAAILRNAFLGRSEQALSGVESTAGWPTKPARLQLAAALAYQRAGLHSELRRTLATIRPGELLPEEVALLNSLR
ncbi:MAG TPA: hypothetical protein VMB21_03205 [Candidatus Limnocylindria bacterium]|nr:hypothetical protein [Candidatus Limnocylindria bacterium]